MRDYLRTEDIIKKFDISRQTLYRWIKKKEISEPDRDWRNWRIWRENNILEIKEKIDKRIYERLQENDKESKVYFEINNRRYLGSKYKLLDFINGVVRDNCTNVNIVADVFGGTGVVADSFFEQGKTIIVNDILESNYHSYNTWFGNGEIDINKVRNIINEFNNIDILDNNYMSQNFGGTYFTVENAKKIGFIREEIEKLSNEITEREKSALITSLLYSMDKVANTCGHYDAFRRKMDSTERLKLLVPNIKNIGLDNNNKIFKRDANELVKDIVADLVYIDTPYNSRQYGDAYHLLENVATWNKPKVEGVAKKMINRAKIKSKYCTAKAPETFEDLIKNINSRYILVSYNNMAQKGVGRSNAKISNEEILTILKEKGIVKVFDTDYKVYTTGKTNVEGHKELLYLCECSK